MPGKFFIGLVVGLLLGWLGCELSRPPGQEELVRANFESIYKFFGGTRGKAAICIGPYKPGVLYRYDEFVVRMSEIEGNCGAKEGQVRVTVTLLQFQDYEWKIVRESTFTSS